MRKAANISRQKELAESRNVALGDPVRGIQTPFIESFKTAGISVNAQDGETSDGSDKAPSILNHFVAPSEFEAAIQESYELSVPTDRLSFMADPEERSKAMITHKEDHERATAALKRILSIENSSSAERTLANKARCIETFGRHNTDKTLAPRPPPNPIFTGGKPLPEKTPRAGPDTGSSEVQIAILTAKINTLADQLETRGGKKDKMNKRNLRLMVHRRQKLLIYMRRKERGGERWQHLVSTLGLTEATYKGEISL